MSARMVRWSWQACRGMQRYSLKCRHWRFRHTVPKIIFKSSIRKELEEMQNRIQSKECASLSTVCECCDMSDKRTPSVWWSGCPPEIRCTLWRRSRVHIDCKSLILLRRDTSSTTNGNECCNQPWKSERLTSSARNATCSPSTCIGESWQSDISTSSLALSCALGARWIVQRGAQPPVDLFADCWNVGIVKIGRISLDLTVLSDAVYK